MVVPSMNNNGINEVITKDIEILCKSSTLVRLSKEYYMERKRYKVKKDDEYTKFYDIKTQSQNTWLVKIAKDQFSKNYNKPSDGCDMMFDYYHFEHDFRIYTLIADGHLAVFNGHFFNRYRERIKLNIPDSLGITKRYLGNNFASTYNYMPEKDGKCKFMALVKEGFIMGEYIIENR